jgi:hypothetical protein
MSQPTTTADIPLNPAPELTTVSQKTVPVRHRVRAPEECTRALPPAITQAGARQKLDTAMSATRARTQPAGAGVGRITTQIWPGAKVTNLTAGTGCLQLHRVQAGAQPAQEPAQEPAGLTKHMQHYVTRIVTREGTESTISGVTSFKPNNPHCRSVSTQISPRQATKTDGRSTVDAFPPVRSNIRSPTVGRGGFRYVWGTVDTRSNHDSGRTRPPHECLNPRCPTTDRRGSAVSNRGGFF